MKSYNNLFEKVVSIDNIKTAIWNASANKRERNDVKFVLSNIDKHAETVRKLLVEDSYVPAHNAECVINEGTAKKSRNIRKPNYAYDQIIHHAIIQVMSPIILEGMDPHVYSSIPGRGPHQGKRVIEKWMSEDIKNTKYCLKLDIRHFYESINQNVLKEKLRKKLRDKALLRLIFKIIDECESGLPLGYYTSQWFANFLLQGLDHFIREELKVTYYVRYMDDMVLLGRNKKELHRCRSEIERYLNDRLGLEMKENWQVFRLDYIDKKTHEHCGRALDFMGFVFYRDRTIIRESIMLRATRKARRLGKKQKITWHDATSMLSYMGWIDNTDSYNMYLGHIKPYVNVKKLKSIVGKHQRRLNREKSKMENCRRLLDGETKDSRHSIKSNNSVS